MVRMSSGDPNNPDVMVDFLNNVTGDQYQRVRSDGTEDTEGNRDIPTNATGEDIDDSKPISIFYLCTLETTRMFPNTSQFPSWKN